MAEKQRSSQPDRELGKLGKQLPKNKKENIEKVAGDTGTENVFSNFRTSIRKAKKNLKEIPSGMLKDSKNKDAIQTKLLKSNKKDPFKEFKDTRREVFGTQRYSKGGRAGYKSGKSVKKKKSSAGKAIRGKGCEIR